MGKKQAAPHAGSGGPDDVRVTGVSALMIEAKSPYAGDDKPLIVKECRRCRFCWGTQQGVGEAYCTRYPTRYYKCQKCGTTWTVRLLRNIDRIESTHTEFMDE